MPIYRFTGDVVFSTTLDENGELHFTIPIEQLKALGIPLGTDVCIQVGYRGATVDAVNRNTAYDVLREHIRSRQIDNNVPLRTTNERSWNWYRADVLWVQERQLLQFTQEEIADPDTILTTLSNQYAPDQPPQNLITAARRRRTKLRRILGLRAFVQAHPNLDIKCRDEISPAARLILNCDENHRCGELHHGSGTSGVAITYLTTTNRIHLKDLASDLEAFIAPTDVHAFDVFMMGVASVAMTHHPQAEVVIHPPTQTLVEEGELLHEGVPF
jgi:hypothetical protein